MIPKITLTILLLLATSSMASKTANETNTINACPPEARLLEVGEFHAEEVEANTGEKWLGLHISDGKSMLLGYQLTVEAVHDVVVDEPDQKTGKKVSVDLPLQPILLIDAQGLSAGPVETVFRGSNEKALEAASPLILKLGDTTYELKVIGSEDGGKCSEGGLPTDAHLVLTSRESTQVLYTLDECGNDPAWHLLWAGDLDKDGKLDLYVSVNQHYNVAEKKLFLSSVVGEGRLVEQVAQFVTTGC